MEAFNLGLWGRWKPYLVVRIVSLITKSEDERISQARTKASVFSGDKIFSQVR